MAQTRTITWRVSLDDALREAQQAGKPVLLDFFSPKWGGCQRLDAVTYHDPAVISALDEQVIPVQLSVLEERNRAVMERYQQVWTPTIVLIHPDGRPFYEWNGYLPPTHYLGHLLLGRGKGALKQHHHEEAARLFDAAAAQDPCDGVGPEARYWGPVARYKGSGKPDDLLGGWQRLRQEYPDSEWRVRQSFTEQ